MSIKVWLER